jgi:hypothetical protein
VGNKTVETGFDSLSRAGTFLLIAASRLILLPGRQAVQCGTFAVSPGVNRSRHEAERLSPSIAVVTNA